MQIAVALFPRVTALDAIGPYVVLQRLPGATVTFVGQEAGEVRTENGFLGLTVDATFDEVTAPDVVIVPGCIGTRSLLAPGTPILDWVKLDVNRARNSGLPVVFRLDTYRPHEAQLNTKDKFDLH